MWQAALAVVPVALYAWKAHAILPAPPMPPRFSTRSLTQVRQFAGGMIATTVTVLLLTQIDKALLSRLMTLESFGYYVLASAVSSALFMLVGPVTAASYPRMVALADDGDGRAEASLYHFVAQLVTVALAPAAFLLAFYAEGVLFVWSGDRVLAGRVAPILSILSVGTLLNALVQVPHSLQLAHGWTSLATYANLLAVAVFVPALWWLVPMYGGVAAAWIWVVLNVGYLLGTAPLMFRRLMPTEMKAWYLEDLARPIGGLLAALLITLLLRPVDYSDRWHWLLFLVLAAVLSWSIAACLAPQVRTQILSWRGRGTPR
jgi:O-antigen/teichoic acid export membrane protein